MRTVFHQFLFSLTVLLLASCSRQKQAPLQTPAEEKKASVSWYMFADGNFRQIEKPAASPEAVFKPWTEAVRISSSGCLSNSQENPETQKTPEAYALVNRCGMLVFSGNEVQLVRDSEFFSRTTAGNLVFYNGTPVFSVFRNSFFNEMPGGKSVMHPFLIQFNPDQKVCYPVINVENLGLSENCEITDYVWDGQFWTCSVKETGTEKINFSYMIFQTKEPLTSIYPTTARDSILIRETSADSFRKLRMPENFSRAPARIRELFSTLPENLGFILTVSTASGHTPRNFLHSKNGNEENLLKATAILNDTWCAALFSDGTLFLNGALFDKYILKSGKNIGLKLPRLPEGFIYSDFAITGTTLYAGWEETSFYQTARSGFLSVDLDQLLYSK